MKKSVCLFLVLAMIFSLALPCLSSCERSLESYDDTAERADELYSRVDARMTELSSYRVIREGAMNATYSGSDMTIDISGETVVSGNRTDGFKRVASSEMTMDYGSETVTIENKEGYLDGMMFESQSGSEGEDFAIKSAVPVEEYVSYLEQIPGNIEAPFSIENCEDLSAEKDEDGNWVAVYSGLRGELYEQCKCAFGSYAAILDGIYFSDIVVTMTVNQDMLIESMVFDVVFASDVAGVTIPTFTLTETYVDHDSAEVEEVDLSSYTDTKNYHYFSLVLSKIDEYLAAEGSYVSNVVTKYKVDNGTGDEVVVYTAGEFSNSKGILTHSLSMGESADNITFNYSYAEGLAQYEYSTGETGRETGSDATQLSLIRSYVDAATIEKRYASRTYREDNEDGTVTYNLVLNADWKEYYKNTLKDATGTDYIPTFEHNILITLDADGNLIEYSFTIKCKLHFSSYYSVQEIEYDIRSLCEFVQPSEDE